MVHQAPMRVSDRSGATPGRRWGFRARSVKMPLGRIAVRAPHGPAPEAIHARTMSTWVEVNAAPPFGMMLPLHIPEPVSLFTR